MFTGIVQTKAVVYSIKTTNNLSRLDLNVHKDFAKDLTLGASIAVNGVCLTVVKFIYQNDEVLIAFDVIEESLKITNLGNLIEGDEVNIERSLKVGDEIGGHMVSGHVHCLAKLIERVETETNCTLRFEMPSKWLNVILPKGFVAINGISLTIGEVFNTGFNVHLIPETLARTNLGGLTINENVNIECDQQTITIVTTLERMKLKVVNPL